MGKKLELICATETTLWGLLLLSPFWDTFENSPSFHMLAQLAPENAWGAFATALGVLQTITVFKGGIYWRSVFALLQIFFFLAIWLMFILANPSATATVTYIVFAGIAGLSYYELVSRRK